MSRRRNLRTVLALTGIALFKLASAVGGTEPVPETPPAASCTELNHTDFSGVPDAPVRIHQAAMVSATRDQPAYCEIKGQIAPTVGFLLRLPAAHWNGKLVALGCGGACGSLDHVWLCDEPLRRGYACVVSDGGHQTDPKQPMKWAIGHPESAVDYLIRSSHVTALAAKAFVEHYYGNAARRSYFMGCSAGGIQAMWLAQRFPWDFDGVIAGAPALSLSRIWLNWLWINRALMGSDDRPVLTAGDLQALHQSVVAQCDLNDGVHDGLIGDPRACQVDPAALRCMSAKSASCLTAQQIEAVTKIYAGPVTSTGQRVAAPLALPGSELTWLDLFAGSERHPTPAYTYLKDWYHYAIFPIDLGPAWKPADFNFDRDPQRLGAMEALEPFHDADLRPFKAAGGKLLMYSGWSDAIEGVSNTVEYYETAQRLLGGPEATRDFFRLFIVPGMNHCAGGEGASAVDWLSALEGWVEHHEAPDRLIGARIRIEDLNPARENDLNELRRRLQFPLDTKYVELTRPIYPYPVQAKYAEHGDVDRASSFLPDQDAK